MKIELDILDAIKSHDFLNYFISNLKVKQNTPFLGKGSAKFHENGTYETFIGDSICTNTGEYLAIQWKIVQNRDGTIPYIEIITSEDRDAYECSNAINEFIQEALKSTIALSKKSFFQRSYFCFVHGSNLMGEYWVGSKLRIAPLYPQDNSKIMNAERIIVIDQAVEAIDVTNAIKLADEKSISIAARLSFIFDIGFYKPVCEVKWFINHNESTGQITNERLQTGIWDTSVPNKMPTKGESCNLSKPVHSMYRLERYTSEDLNFPLETRKIFNILDSTDLKNKLAFDRSCRLYQTALTAGAYSPTIKLSYMVGAVDAIAQSTMEHKSFSGFMRNYSPGVQDDFLDFIHRRIRSSHWHGGDFILGENESNFKEFLLDQNSHLRFNIIKNGHKIIRTAILNWLFELENK